MGDFATTLSPAQLIGLIGTRHCPRVIDVRRQAVYAEAEDLIPTAVWRDHAKADVWAADLPPGEEIVVYCVHGHQVSQSAAALLRAEGRRVRALEGGIEGYREAGGVLIRKDALPERDAGRPSRWVTRERPKIDRIACPWLIRRFVDRDAEIHFVDADWVKDSAVELDAIAFDIPDVEFSHVGEKCSFDAFLAWFAVADKALDRVATIVRGADTGHPELAPEAPGLLALSLGLSAIEGDDLAMLEQGFLLYDALYGWARHALAERHGWPPAGAKKAS